LITILLLGLALRLYRLDALPLRGDEGFSAQNWAAQPFLVTLRTTATIEPHPPLTYAVFRAWGVLFGTQHELILRLLPALGNLIGIAALYALGRRLHSRAAGLLAAFFWAINPYQIWHAQDFRNYALWSSTSAVTLWLALHVIQRRRPLDWVLYGGAMLISSLIFYFDLLAMGAVGLFVLAVSRRERGFIMRWLLVNSVIAGIVMATFLVLQGPLIGSGSYAGTTAYADPIQLITVFLPTIAFGDTLPAAVLPILGTVAALLFVVGLWFIGRGRAASSRFSPAQAALFLALLGIAPLVVLCAAALKFGIFTPRYVMLSAPAYILLGCLVMVQMWQTGARRGRFLAVTIGLMWVALNAYTLNLYYHDPLYHKTRDWRALSVYLAHNVAPDDLVIQTAVDAGFGYYYHLIGGAALDIGLPDNFDQPAAEIRQVLAQRAAMHRSLWIVARTFRDWPNYGIVEAWVEEHLQLVRQTVIDDLPVRQYMRWEVVPDEIGSTPLATLAPTVDLAGAKLFLPAEPTGEITLWLYWRPRQRSKTPLKVFVHVLGDINPATGTPLWAQSDYEPQQGRVHTDSWAVGTVYRDVYTLTVRDLPAGDYHIVAGLYDPLTNTRVLTADGQDSIPIGVVHLP